MIAAIIIILIIGALMDSYDDGKPDQKRLRQSISSEMEELERIENEIRKEVEHV